MNNKYENIYVADSKIHGKGILAKKRFGADEIVCEFTGEIIDEKECVQREKEGNVYFLVRRYSLYRRFKRRNHKIFESFMQAKLSNRSERK
jgi:hypothetical protein